MDAHNKEIDPAGVPLDRLDGKTGLSGCPLSALLRSSGGKVPVARIDAPEGSSSDPMPHAFSSVPSLNPSPQIRKIWLCRLGPDQLLAGSSVNLCVAKIVANKFRPRSQSTKTIG